MTLVLVFLVVALFVLGVVASCVFDLPNFYKSNKQKDFFGYMIYYGVPFGEFLVISTLLYPKIGFLYSVVSGLVVGFIIMLILGLFGAGD